MSDNLSPDDMQQICNINGSVNISNHSSDVVRMSKSSLSLTSLSDNSVNENIRQIKLLDTKRNESAVLYRRSNVHQSLGRRLSSTFSKRRRSSINTVQQSTDTTCNPVDLIRLGHRVGIMRAMYSSSTMSEMTTEDILRETKANAVLKNPSLFQMFQDTLCHSVSRYKPWGALNGFHSFLDEYIRIPEIKEQIIERRKEENNGCRRASRILKFIAGNRNAISHDASSAKTQGGDIFQMLSTVRCRTSSKGQFLSFVENSKTTSPNRSPRSYQTSSETNSPSTSDDARYDYNDDDDQSFNEDFTRGWRTSLSPDNDDSTSPLSDNPDNLPFLPNFNTITFPSRHSHTDDDCGSDVVSCSDDSSEYEGVDNWDEKWSPDNCEKFY
jgi:hypothetical protein